MDDNGKPLDANYDLDDLAPETLAKVVEDCQAFQRDNAVDIGDQYERAGHDFWLTRNRHGAGFWDGDWEEAVGERLTAASHAFGEIDWYIGDDGLIYS